jgi:hypothetical protein
VKYLLQADWERLVKNAERYEAMCALLFNASREDMSVTLSDAHKFIDALCDAELDRQADASRRANGGSECKVCGREYRKHPKGGPLGVGDEQFLNRLCDGSLVKL